MSEMSRHPLLIYRGCIENFQNEAFKDRKWTVYFCKWVIYIENNEVRCKRQGI